MLTEADLAICGQCLFRVRVTMIGWPEKSKGFVFRYFAYPKALTRGLSTALGPIGGGLNVKAIVEDFEGPGTRRGAGGLSLFQVLSEAQRGMVSFTTAGAVSLANLTNIEESSAYVPSSTNGRVFVLSFVQPPSPTDEEGVAAIAVLVGGETLPLAQTSVSFDFKYVGAELLGIIPPAGNLNPGSGGLSVFVQVSNLKTSAELPEVTIGGRATTVSVGSPAPHPVGTMTVVTVTVPELPLAMVGELTINLTATSLKGKVLGAPFIYTLPPAPTIDFLTMVIDDKSGGWAASSRFGFEGQVTVKNLSPKNGVFYNSVRMFFGDSEGRILGLRQGLTDLTVTFLTPPDGMPASTVKTNITFYQDGAITAAVKTIAEPRGEQFLVEFRDVRTPRIEYLAPLQAPARGPLQAPAPGGVIGMVSVLSFPDLVNEFWDRVLHFKGPVNETINVTVLGDISLAAWLAGGPEYQAITSLPAVSGFRVGLNAEAESLYTTLLASTELTLLQTTFDPAQAAKDTIILLFEIPRVSEASAGLTPYSFSLTNAGNASDPENVPVTLSTSMLSFFPAPTGPASSVLARTLLGKPESGLDGNVQLMITLGGFDVVYKPSEVYVLFAENPTPISVSRIIAST